jgi:hypothetical protein
MRGSGVGCPALRLLFQGTLVRLFREPQCLSSRCCDLVRAIDANANDHAIGGLRSCVGFHGSGPAQVLRNSHRDNKEFSACRELTNRQPQPTFRAPCSVSVSAKCILRHTSDRLRSFFVDVGSMRPKQRFNVHMRDTSIQCGSPRKNSRTC